MIFHQKKLNHVNMGDDRFTEPLPETYSLAMEYLSYIKMKKTSSHRFETFEDFLKGNEESYTSTKTKLSGILTDISTSSKSDKTVSVDHTLEEFRSNSRQRDIGRMHEQIEAEMNQPKVLENIERHQYVFNERKATTENYVHIDEYLAYLQAKIVSPEKYHSFQEYATIKMKLKEDLNTQMKAGKWWLDERKKHSYKIASEKSASTEVLHNGNLKTEEGPVHQENENPSQTKHYTGFHDLYLDLPDELNEILPQAVFINQFLKHTLHSNITHEDDVVGSKPASSRYGTKLKYVSFRPYSHAKSSLVEL